MFLRQRFNSFINSSMHSEEILAVGEAARSLDECDRIGLQRWQAAAQSKESDLACYKNAYDQNQRSIAGKRSNPAKNIGSAYKGPWCFALNSEHIDQKTAKSYFPAGSYVWRARATDSWNAWDKIFPVHSCRDSAWGGEVGAIRECARFCLELAFEHVRCVGRRLPSRWHLSGGRRSQQLDHLGVGTPWLRGLSEQAHK